MTRELSQCLAAHGAYDGITNHWSGRERRAAQFQNVRSQMRRFALLSVGYAVSQVLAGGFIGWYYVFALLRFDPKFCRAPLVAWQIHLEVLALFALLAVGIIGTLLALGSKQWAEVRKVQTAAVGAAVGLGVSCLYFLGLEFVRSEALPWIFLWLLPIGGGALSVRLGRSVNSGRLLRA